MWETNPREIPQKTFQLLMGPQQVTGPETLQGIYNDDDAYNNCQNNMMYL